MVIDRAFVHLYDLLVRSLRAHSAATLVVEADGTAGPRPQFEITHRTSARVPLTQVGKRDKKALRRAFVEQETPETSGDKR